MWGCTWVWLVWVMSISYNGWCLLTLKPWMSIGMLCPDCQCIFWASCSILATLFNAAQLCQSTFNIPDFLFKPIDNDKVVGYAMHIALWTYNQCVLLLLSPDCSINPPWCSRFRAARCSRRSNMAIDRSFRTKQGKGMVRSLFLSLKTVLWRIMHTT